MHVARGATTVPTPSTSSHRVVADGSVVNDHDGDVSDVTAGGADVDRRRRGNAAVEPVGVADRRARLVRRALRVTHPQRVGAVGGEAERLGVCGLEHAW